MKWGWDGKKKEAQVQALEIGEDETIDTKLYKPTGPDGKGWGEFR